MLTIEELDKYYKENYSFDVLKKDIYENDEFIAFKKRLSDFEFNAIKYDLEGLFEIWFNLGMDLGVKYGQIIQEDKNKELLEQKKKENEIFQKLADFVDEQHKKTV